MPTDRVISQAETPAAPEVFLQFGCGNFLRAFIDLFLAESNRAGTGSGRVIAVQSTGQDRAQALRAAHCAYHVAIRGLAKGRIIDRVEWVDSISRVIIARQEWDDFLATARLSSLRWITSNVTESGLQLSPDDRRDSRPPQSFPAKLLVWLHERWKLGGTPVVVLPCELVPQNADVLRALVDEQAGLWKLETAFLKWLRHECRWVNTLVDRIVSGRPAAHPLLEKDPLLIATEPFALWVLEGEPLADFPLVHPAVIFAPSVQEYQLRKIRILNGAHTALAARALPLGLETVRAAVEDGRIGPWLRELLFTEIVPVLEGRVDHPREFAEQTLERFQNPYLDHKLSDIAKGHEQKILHRLRPTLEEFGPRFGREPRLLAELLRNGP
jgi:tagaturonate reductase